MDNETTVSPAPSKRRWFQLHLSTAFITMVAAGAIMCVFFTQTPVRVYSFKMGRMGWPWTSVCKINAVDPYRETSAEIFDEIQIVKTGDYFVSYYPLMADIGVILGALIVVATVFELPIRWDDREKEKRLSLRRAHKNSIRHPAIEVDSLRHDSPPNSNILQ